MPDDLPTNGQGTLRIYYAHSMKEYGSQRELDDLNLIGEHFAPCEVFNPAGKFTPSGWRLWLRAAGMRSFDVVIVREYRGFVGRGVCSELRSGLALGKRVLVLRDDVFLEVRGLVVYNQHDWEVKYAKVVV